MKKNVVQFTVVAFIILFSSCKKNSNNDAAVNTNKVKSYTEDVSGSGFSSVTTYNLSYDASDRIISIISATSPGDKFLFSYNSDTKYSMDLYSSSALSIHEDFFLNSSSLPDSTFQYNDTKDTMTEKYFYNANNQLVKMNEYNYYTIPGPQLSNTTNYTYDTNGNLIETLDTNNNMETYEYYTDLIYTMPPTSPYSNSTKKMNLVKKHTVTSNGYPVGSSNVTYTFDSNNRISTTKETLDDGSVFIKTFTYF